MAVYNLGWVVAIGTMWFLVLGHRGGWGYVTLLETMIGLKDPREALTAQAPFQ